jgi:hypothetical protein
MVLYYPKANLDEWWIWFFKVDFVPGGFLYTRSGGLPDGSAAPLDSHR